MCTSQRELRQETLLFGYISRGSLAIWSAFTRKTRRVPCALDLGAQPFAGFLLAGAFPYLHCEYQMLQWPGKC